MRKYLIAAVAAVASSVACAQQARVDYWQALAEMPDAVKAQDAWVRPVKYGAWQLTGIPKLKASLVNAPLEFTPEGDARPLEFPVPKPDGTFAWFAIVEAPVMEPGLAAEFPDIKTYRGQGLDDPSATVRLDFTEQGFHASVLSPGGSYYVDPFCRAGIEYYSSYYVTDLRPSSPFVCHTADPANQTGLNNEGFDGGYGDRVSGTTLRTFTLAMAATGEFTAFHGGTQALAQAAIVTGVNRITQVWENECAIRFTLVTNNQNIVYTNAATDPYTGNDLNAMLGENQTNVNAVIGSANYDIGHVVTAGNLGGLAQLGVVCNTAKARGGTGLSAPTGDYFWVSYVCHEMGHQFNATHSFNSNTSPCVENRSATTAYEPGGGCTLMSYAGVCGVDNILTQSGPYFHTASYDQIITFATSRTCDTETATGNTVPTANAGIDRTIPMGTAFKVVGTATDANSDPLTYCWEQKDLGAAQSLAEMLATDNGTSPIFRSYAATTDASRTFPRLADVVDGSLSAGERYPVAARTLDLRFTVRDNRSAGGGVNADSMVVNIRADSGPFTVTAPNTAGVTWTPGSTQTVTWSVANTNAAPVSCANVNILLSTDSGNNYTHVLASGTPNDGSADIVVPAVNSILCRVRVEAADNIFFDVSNFNISILCSTPPLPVNVQATDGTLCDQVLVTWNPIAEATQYEVLRNTINLGSSATNIGTTTSPTFSDTTAVSGQTYYYFVRSTTACGTSGVSISNSGARGLGPAVPIGVNASDGLSCSAVSVGWTASAGATGYEVWRATVNNPAAASPIGAVAVNSFSDLTAVSGTTYYYFVLATSPCGNSALGTGDAGFASTAPAAPSGVLASDANCANVQVTWSNGAGASGYEVLRSTSNNSATASVVGAPTSSPFNDATAVAGTTYFYWVRSIGTCGTSSLAGPDSGVRSSTPSVPTSLVATDATLCDRVDLTWAISQGATSYQVVRSATNDPNAGTVVGAPTASTFSDTTGSAGTAYFYFVSAVNSCGNSAFSTGDQGTRAVTPVAPTAVTASDAAQCDRVDVSWSAAAGATGYEIYRANADDSGAALSIGTTAAASFADTTATPGVTHYYFVKSTSSCGASAFSASDAGSLGTAPSAPSAVTTDRNNFCENDAGTILLSATGASGTTRWYTGACEGTEIGTGPTLLVNSPTTTTTYFARNETPCGASACASATISVTPGPAAPTAIAFSRDNLCADDSGQVQLTALGGNGGTLRWFAGDCNGAPVGTGNPLTLDSPIATTQYFARWESPCGESTCASGVLTVVPTPSVASVALSGSSPYSLGSSATVTVALDTPAPAAGSAVTISSPAFAPLGISIIGGQTSGQATVTFTAFGNNLQASALGAACAAGSVGSSAFSVTAGPIIYVSTTGDDSNAGTSAAAPVLHVQTALSRVGPGGSVRVAAGLYNEPLTVDRAVSIVGESAAATILSGGTTGRVIDITGPHAVSLAGLLITNGQTPGDGAGIRAPDGSSLTITDCIVAGNVASGRGGGIDAAGTLTMTGSTLSANSAASGGGLSLGAGANTADGAAQITNSTISGNDATGPGGGVWIGGSAPAHFTHATIADNSAADGGGIFISPGADARLGSSLIAANAAGVATDVSGTLLSLGFNLVTNSSGTTGLLGVDIVGQDPLLALLADNGGPTPTHALGAGSPAIDGADPACVVTTDQRGVSRPLDGNGDATAVCDIGAFEVSPPACPWQVAGCPADYDNSGGVDGDDVISFFADWDAGATCSDVDLSGGTDGDDVILFFSLWDLGGC